jgi:hypothetical protein
MYIDICVFGNGNNHDHMIVFQNFVPDCHRAN